MLQFEIRKVFSKSKITTLKEWLNSGEEIYTEAQKAFLIQQAVVIIPVYAVICLILQPVLYKVYKGTEIK